MGSGLADRGRWSATQSDVLETVNVVNRIASSVDPPRTRPTCRRRSCATSGRPRRPEGPPRDRRATCRRLRPGNPSSITDGAALPVPGPAIRIAPGRWRPASRHRSRHRDRGVRPAPAGGRRRDRGPPAAQARPLPHAPVRQRLRGRGRARPRAARHGAERVHHAARAHHDPQVGVRHRRVLARWDTPGSPVSCGVGFLVRGWLGAGGRSSCCHAALGTTPVDIRSRASARTSTTGIWSRNDGRCAQPSPGRWGKPAVLVSVPQSGQWTVQLSSGR